MPLGAALIGAGASIIGNYMNNRANSQNAKTSQTVTPSDQFSMNMLGDESEQEAILAALQQALFGQSANQLLSEGMPQALSLENLSAGNISGASAQRLDQAAFGNLNEGLRRAGAIAQESAGARGLDFSSIQGVQEAELQRPLIQNAATLRARLEQEEISRLNGLRQNYLGNMMQMQNSPALTRLMQIRQSQSSQINLARKPGGLPDFVGQKIQNQTGMDPSAGWGQEMDLNSGQGKKDFLDKSLGLLGKVPSLMRFGF